MSKSFVLKLFPSIIVALLAAILALLLHFFGAHYCALSLEGSSLSGLRTTVEDPSGDARYAVLDELGERSAGTYALGTLTENENVQVISSQNYASIPIPLHQGRTFANDSCKEALVGSGVEVLSDEGTLYVEVLGERYEVVGRLGTHPSSVLQSKILLKDEELFCTAAFSSLSLNGILPGLSEKEGEASYSGMRRASLDLVGPFVFSIGGLFVVTGYACAGLLFGYRQAPESRVLHLLGLPPWKIVLRRLLPPSICSGIATAVCLAAYFQIAQESLVFADVYPALLLLVAVLVAGASSFLWLSSEERGAR